MVFVTNHTSFCVLKCGHEHNEEEDPRGADKYDGDNYIISKKFNQIRHDVASVQGLVEMEQ